MIKIITPSAIAAITNPINARLLSHLFTVLPTMNKVIPIEIRLITMIGTWKGRKMFSAFVISVLVEEPSWIKLLAIVNVLFVRVEILEEFTCRGFVVDVILEC
jgi:hypothetical protein